jgi:small nuclear ribonucleoprotein D3
MSIGVPIKLLHESENHYVTIELKTGQLFKGVLIISEVSPFFLLSMTKLG